MSSPQQQQKAKIKKIVLLSVLAFALFFGIKKIYYNINHETTDNAQIECQIVPILTRTSGYVKNLYVQDFDSISQNQFLVELDDAELQSQLAEMIADSVQAAADVVNAKASLQNAITALEINKGNIAVGEVKLQQATSDYNRNKNLLADQAITQKQLDDSKFSFQSADKLLENNKNDFAASKSKIPVLESVIKKNEALLEVKSAKINEIKLKLSYTKIYAPASGKIGKKNITLGQFVQVGTPLFSIVNDSLYWVTANFKENQISKFHIGKEMDLRIDAFPDEHITGTIESISDATGAKFALLPPDNSSGNFVKVTQRIPVKIKINNIEKYKPYLRAGLSVFVSTPTN